MNGDGMNLANKEFKGCSEHSGHESRLNFLERSYATLETQIGNKLNTRIFLVIVLIAIAVLGSCGAAIWHMSDSMHDGFTSVTKEVSEVRVEVGKIQSDVEHMKDDITLIQEARADGQ